MAVSMKRAAARKKAVKSSKENLEDIFEDQLKDIYWAEKHLTRALPKMARAAFNQDLVDAFNTHLEETKMQVGRIEKCFELLGKRAAAKKCEAMEGLVEEGDEAIEEYDEETLSDLQKDGGERGQIIQLS